MKKRGVSIDRQPDLHFNATPMGGTVTRSLRKPGSLLDAPIRRLKPAEGCLQTLCYEPAYYF